MIVIKNLQLNDLPQVVARFADVGPQPGAIRCLQDRLLQRFGFSGDELAQTPRQFRYEFATYDADCRKLSFPPTPWQTHGNLLAVHQDALPMVEARLRGA